MTKSGRSKCKRSTLSIRKGGVVFHSWSVQTGPTFEQLQDVWTRIDKDLAKNDLNTAAGRLRRHLEYVSAELAANLGAKPVFRGDFSYDFDDLLTAVIGRYGELLKLAAKSAQHWIDEEAKRKVEALTKMRSEAMDKYGGENWLSIKPCITATGKSFRNRVPVLREERMCILVVCKPAQRSR